MSLDQREFLAVLDWVLETPERWNLAVNMATCLECNPDTGVCERHRDEFRKLNGRDVVDV